MFSEYSMDCPYAARTWSESRHTASGDSPCAGMPSKTEPSPTSFQSTMCGSGAHGVWLDTRSISAITGARSRLGELEALEGRQGVLVGHRGVAERRAAVADVAAS